MAAYKLTFQYFDTKREERCEMALWGYTKDAAYSNAYQWAEGEDITVISLYRIDEDVNISNGFRIDVEEVA